MTGADNPPPLVPPLGSLPWSLQVDATIDEDGDGPSFISRTIVGQNFGGGVEVAIVTTGAYTDEVEAQHAQLLLAAPLLLRAVEAGHRMRALQVAYFKGRDRGVLVASKEAEHLFDKLVREAIAVVSPAQTGELF